MLPPRSPSRIAQLDGLRGVSSLLVCVHHFAAGFVPRLIAFNMLPMPWFARTPLSVFFSGNFVYLFFVLSGFVLAESAQRRGQPFLLRSARRYIRLAVPITLSLAFAWLCIRTFPFAAHRMVSALPQRWMQYSYSTDLPGFREIFPEGFYWVFRHGYSLYNNSLWTMHNELYGSLYIFLIYLVRDTRKRLAALLLAGLCTLFLLHGLLSFVLGALIREAWVAGKLRSNRWGAPAFAAALIFISSQPVLSRTPDRFIYPAGGALALLGAFWSPRVAGFFRTPVPQFLGRISFSLYLLHVPLLMTAFATIYLAWLPMNAWKVALLFGGFLAVAVTIGYAMTIAVDEPLTRFLRASSERFMGRHVVPADLRAQRQPAPR